MCVCVLHLAVYQRNRVCSLFDAYDAINPYTAFNTWKHVRAYYRTRMALFFVNRRLDYAWCLSVCLPACLPSCLLLSRIPASSSRCNDDPSIRSISCVNSSEIWESVSRDTNFSQKLYPLKLTRCESQVCRWFTRPSDAGGCIFVRWFVMYVCINNGGFCIQCVYIYTQFMILLSWWKTNSNYSLSSHPPPQQLPTRRLCAWVRARNWMKYFLNMS